MYPRKIHAHQGHFTPQFSKIASRGYQGRMTLTGQGLVLGAGTLLAKLDDNALPIEADQERIWTLLSVAYGEKISPAMFGSLRRVAKHWHGGDKSLAAIHLAQMGLPDIGEDAAYRLSLAAELIGAGVAPRELARELELNPIQFDVSKYDENQTRVPAGSGGEASMDLGERLGAAADRGEVGGGGEFRQSQRSTRPSQGCHRRHAARRHDHRRSKVPHKEAHGSATGKFPGGLCGWKTNIRGVRHG